MTAGARLEGHSVVVTGAAGSPSTMTTTQQRMGHRREGSPAPDGGGVLLSNLSWSVLAEAVRLVSSFVAFLILLRIYPPGDFGRLVATTALAMTLFPLASVGGGWLTLRRVTNDGWSTERALAVTSGMTILGSVVVGSIAVVIRPLILPQMPVLLFIGVMFGDMLLLGLVEVTLFAAQANERLVAKAVAWSVYGLGRAGAAAIVLHTVDEPGLGVWIVASIGIGLAVVLVAQRMTVGRLVGPTTPRWIDVRDGLPYSFGFGVERLMATSDNVLLVRLGFSIEAGLYAAARRLLTVSLAPCMAALHAVSARLWQAGARSVSDARTLAVRFTGYGVVYGLVSLVAWLVLGDVLSRLLGSTYRESAEILPWLSVLPLLTMLELFVATALTAADLHNRRVVLSAAAGLVNIGLNIALIPAHGWRGAVIASLISSVAYVIGLWLTLTVAARREPAVSFHDPDPSTPGGCHHDSN